jgi:hypothetical protein
MSLHTIKPLICFTCGLVMVCDVYSALSFYSGMLFMLAACLMWQRNLETQGAGT